MDSSVTVAIDLSDDTTSLRRKPVERSFSTVEFVDTFEVS
jgi:hypothetical protein